MGSALIAVPYEMVGPGQTSTGQAATPPARAIMVDPGSESGARPGALYVEWLRKFEREVADQYERLHREAIGDPQKAGHEPETTWAAFFKEWLPASYGVGTRRFVIPEVGDDQPEMDLVIFRPSYPEKLRERSEVFAGGVAAAFSVRLTLDAKGVADGFDRALRLRRGMLPRSWTLRRELLGPFPVGLLAHSHEWKAPNSNPEWNVSSRLWTLAEQDAVRHPRDLLDWVCVADLNTWFTSRVTWYSPQQEEVGSAIMVDRPEYSESTTPVGSLLTKVLARLSYDDRTLAPIAEGFRLAQTEPTYSGRLRKWPADAVYSGAVRQRIQQGALSVNDPEWLFHYY